jgi:hypothetical protein
MTFISGREFEQFTARLQKIIDEQKDDTRRLPPLRVYNKFVCRPNIKFVKRNSKIYNKE